MAARFVVAHRTPQSPAECADLAAAGASFFEVDVQLRCGELAVSHYLPTLGTRGRFEHDNLRFRRTPGALIDPLFADAVAAIPADRTVLVDPKEKTRDGIAALTRRLATDLVPRVRFVVSTSSPAALDELRASGVRTWRTVRNPRQLRTLLGDGQIADEAVTVRHVLLRPAVVARLHDIAPTVVAWTVNSMPRMHQLLAWGVDGITTDSRHLMANIR